MFKVAVMIDGGYFLKRFSTIYPDVDSHDSEAVAGCLRSLIGNHLRHLNKTFGETNHWALLHRSFYYDAKPYVEKAHFPVSKKSLDYSNTPEAIFRTALYRKLRRTPNMALRLGTVRKEGKRSWILKRQAQAQLLGKERTVDDLTDADFAPALRQKGVDMRLGIDMATLTLKGLVDTIVLVAGDSDFVPAAKLARREGIRIVLDPLWQNVDEGLFEHIDGVYSGVPRPKKTV